MLSSVSAQEARSSAGSTRPNVLMIIADDLGTQLGCLGDPLAKTPNIDGLAEAGISFTRAYVQATGCNPSRISLLSGQRPPSTGIFENRFWPELDVFTLPEHFEQHGYETVKIGKILHHVRRARLKRQAKGSKKHDRRVWSSVLHPAGLGKESTREPQPSKGGFSSDKPASQAGLIKWGAKGDDFFDAFDARVAKSAVQFLRQAHEKPFFLAVGFAKPHLPFFAPKPYMDRFSDLPIDLPDVAPDDLHDVPEIALREGKDSPEIDPDHWREAVRAYRACVALVDDCVGHLLAGLEEAGLRENTIVLFLSDHGQLLGEHNLWFKGMLFEECARVPLILSAPGAGFKGNCDRLVEYVDVYPTLAELCGLPLPGRLEGVSLVPLLQDPTKPWKRAAFSYEDRGVSMRTERWRMTRWQDGEVELYDHDNDSEEHDNLAHSSEHTDVLAELGQLLEGGWRTCLPESPK